MNKFKILFVATLPFTLSSCSGGSSPSPSPTPETTYTVTFNSNGGSNVPSQNIKSGEKATRPSDPKKDGYTFDNWYKDNSLTNIYDFSSPVITNLTLYAKWNVNSYTVTFNTNGGSEIPSQTVNHGGKVTRPSDPKKDGYTFENWYKESSLSNVYDFSSPVITNLTLYAKWNVNSYTVTFNTNGGSEIPSQTVNHGEKVNKPNQPTKSGYYFYNWFADSTLETIFDFNTTYVTSDITIYVKWSEPISYNITYILNGGTNDPDNPSTYTVEDSIIFKFATHSEAEFDKWTDESGNTITHIELGTYGDITLYANWKNWKEYQVNVYTNDETKGTAQGGGTYDYGSEVSITASPLDDYVFNGWYSDSEYKTLLTKNNIYKFTLSSGDVSFYAKFWTKEEEEEEEWNKSHGVIPVISEDGKTLTYGLYPQIHVVDPEQGLIDAGKNKSDEEYFFYNNEYYVKDSGNPADEDSIFLDGEKVVAGETYYFKCAPITWNIISSGENYLIDCSNILYAHRFDDDSNIYKDSELRAWLNGDFYNKAFSIKTTSSYIVDTDLEDVDVRDDKVWVGSKDQYDGQWYKDYSERKKKVNDFAICNHAHLSQDGGYNPYGWYWTRSSYSNGNSEPCAWNVANDGVLSYDYVDSGDVCCSPSLFIKI